MKSTGMLRQVDELGRIVLPIELRRVLEVAEGDSMEFFVDRETKRIMVRKYRTQECYFCKTYEDIHYYREKFICSSCLQELKSGDYASETTESEPAAAAGGLEAEERQPEEDNDRRAARRGGKRTDTLMRLVAAMKEHPGATQSQWARMIVVSASRVNQLIRRDLPE